MGQVACFSASDKKGQRNNNSSDQNATNNGGQNFSIDINQNQNNRSRSQNPDFEMAVKIDTSNLREYKPKDQTQINNYQILEVKDKNFNNTEKFEQLRQQLGSSNLYEDPEFNFRNRKILFGENPENQHPTWSPIQFQRISELFANQQAMVFQGKIEPNDIQQGILGDCYLLSSLAALSEFPQLIERLFNTKQYNPQGFYSLNFCLTGKWQEVIVDDYIPTIDQRPCFTKAQGPEVWVLLLEKAWAKLHNSYDNIEGGLVTEVLHDLTGAPVENKFLDEIQDREQLWQELLFAERNNYVMGTGSLQSFEGKAEHNGIQAGHAYTLIGAFELKVDGKDVRLIKLRNPWGRVEYQGSWSDKDDQWNKVSQQEKQRLGYTNEDDGSFFMDYTYFNSYFDVATICHVNGDFKTTSNNYVSNTKQSKFFKVRVTKPGRYYLCVDQKTSRNYPSQLKQKLNNQFYSYCLTNISKIMPDGSFKHLSGKHESQRNSWILLDNLEAGEYMVQVKFDWKFDEANPLNLNLNIKQNTFGFGFYGVDYVDIQEAQKSQAQNFISSMLLQHALENIKNHQWDGIKTASGYHGGYFYQAWWNNAPDRLLELSYQNKSKLLKKPYKSKNPKVPLKTGENSIAFMRVKYDANGSFDPGLQTGLSLQ